jgi:hypothetical protein
LRHVDAVLEQPHLRCVEDLDAAREEQRVRPDKPAWRRR